MEKNYWPDLQSEENTKGIFEFVNILKNQLHSKYDGKLNCSFEKIEYESNGVASLSSAVAGINKIMAPQEEKGVLEKSKKKVDVKKYNEYKFLIYNDNYFFRIFDVKIGEHFPIQMRPGEELSNIECDYIKVDSLAAFKHEVELYLSNETIKDVISYMIRF